VIASAGEELTLVHGQGKGERCVAGTAGVVPIRALVVVDAELKLSEVGLSGRHAGVGFYREVKSAARSGIIHADDIPWNVIEIGRKIHPNGQREIVRG
jgi:hypothetical protein